MKERVAFILFLLVLTLACEKDRTLFDVVDGQTLASFGSTSVDLGVPVEGAQIDVFVNVTTASENPRTISLEIDSSSTAASEQYTVTDSGIPAGSFRGTVTITGNFEALPETGATTLVLNLTDVSGSNDLALYDSSLTVALFRECDSQPSPGLWTVNMSDSYGDGWQTTTNSGGPGLTCTLSSGEVFEFGLCTPWEEPAYDCTPGTSSGMATIHIPEGTASAEWYFPGDFWGEIAFSIVAPNGNVVAEYGPGSPPGPVIIDFCQQ